MAHQDCWALYEKQFEGQAVRIRLNEGVEEYVCHPRYMYQHTITVPLSDVDESGFPFPEECKLLDELELLLKDRLEAQQVAVFVAVVTTLGHRLYILYTYMPDFCKKVTLEIDRLWIYHQLSSSCEVDREWKMVEGLL